MQQAVAPVQPDLLRRRIAFVRQRFSRFGGGELMIDRIVTALASRGTGIKLIARSWEERPGVEFVRCDPPRFPRSKRDSRFAESACAIVTADGDLLVQSHERMPCCDIYRAGDGVHAAYLAHRARGMGFFPRLFQDISPYHRDVVRLERRMFESPRLKAVIANSAMVADEISTRFDFPRAKIHQIPNGIDLSRFVPETIRPLREPAREKLGIAPAAHVLILIGSGYARKGLAVAIEALATSKCGATLLVVGHDKHERRYAALAQKFGVDNQIRLLGKRDDPRPFLAAADAMILPSIYDPFPSATIEALACGLPVITSESCGARDLVRELDLRLVRDAYDAAGFAEAIDAALELSSRPETGERCRALAAGFGMDAMIDKMLALYEELLTQ